MARVQDANHDPKATISEGLPECEGPKLQPFRSRLHDQPEPVLEFLEVVSKGGTAYAVKARIDGHIYALKVFCRFRIGIGTGWGLSERSISGKVDEKTLTSYIHPFFAECRAYGRLKEVNKEHLAAHCHGYLMLTAQQQKDLETKLGPFDWNDEEGDLEDGPLRALVKDFIPGSDQFHAIQARKMIHDMKQLHRCGILMVDVKSDMYVDGIIVDFSHAQTLPHLFFEPENGFDAYQTGQERVYNDLADLSRIFGQWNNNPRNKPKIPKKMEF